MIDLIEFRKVFDFIQDEMPSTELNDTELRAVYEQYAQWQGETLPIHDVSVSLKSCINCKYYRKNKPHINTPLHECVVSNIERSLKTPSTFSCTQFHSR